MDTHWTLDRRVPILALAGLLLQTILFVFWFGHLSQQVNQNTQSLRDKRDDGNRLAVIETRVGSLDSSITRLTNTIDRLLRERPPAKIGD